MMQKFIIEENFELDENILDLVMLATRIDSMIHSGDLKTKNFDIVEKIIDLRTLIGCATELLFDYENAKDENLKHEFGYQYSEMFVDIEDMVEELSGMYTNLYFH